MEKKTINNPKCLCVAAGGSGGHILPAIIIAREWRQQNPDGRVLFFCQDKDLDKKILAQNKIADFVIALPAAKFFVKKPWLYPLFIFQILRGFISSFTNLIKHKPEKVISTGGSTAVPVALAAWLQWRPIEVYELNVVPGKSIKFLALFAQKIFIMFDESKKYLNFMGINFASKCQITRYPIRFTAADKVFDKNKELAALRFSAERKTIFLLGGSQGSVFLNNLTKKFVELNPKLHNKIQIIHQAGLNDVAKWEVFYQKQNIPAIVFDYNQNIKSFYLLSDLIIARAGAGTIFEIEFFQKHALLIPLVAASTTHQVQNAEAMCHKSPYLFTMLRQETTERNFQIFSDLVTKTLNI